MRVRVEWEVELGKKGVGVSRVMERVGRCGEERGGRCSEGA